MNYEKAYEPISYNNHVSQHKKFDDNLHPASPYGKADKKRKKQRGEREKYFAVGDPVFLTAISQI